jgi:hypothetical protein
MSLSVASVIQTTTRELQDLANVPKSVRLDRLRSTINQSKRKLVSLQNELSNLKSAETLVLQKLNRFVSLSDLQQYYPADRFMTNEPKAGIKPVENVGFPDPDPRVNWTRNRLLNGVEPLEAERNRIGTEILKISLEIVKQRQALSDAQTELGTDPDTSVDLAKDGIAKRNFSELYMLYEIHKKYRDISTNADGSRKYNSDDPTIKAQNRLKSMFNSYAGRNPYVLSGDLILDQNDPGSDENESMLMSMMNRVFSVLGNQTNVSLNDQNLQKYSNQMISNTNDAFISQNVARQDDSKDIPTSDLALKNNTQTGSSLVSFVNEVATQQGLKIYMSWDQTSVSDSIQSWFQSQVSNLNQGMPLCVPKPVSLTTPTTADQFNAELQAADATALLTEQSAAEQQAAQFAQTKKVVDPDVIASKFALLMQQVINFINDPSGKSTSATTSLTIESPAYTTYSATVLHQVRVLNAAAQVTSYLIQMKVSNNLIEADYDSYIKKLIKTLATEDPPLMNVSTYAG